MSNSKWRFPIVKGGVATGRTTGDRETFKKNPYSSLAREILQNSIDASISDEEPVIVEFKGFNTKAKDIPDIEGLTSQIQRCKEFWKHKQDWCDVYDEMVSMLNKEDIACLRISDFNTTGLSGIRSDKLEGNKYIALVKGTGVSEKGSISSGGSKGVGKNAALEQSALDLLFYSTITDRNEKGTIGVANFASGYSIERPNDSNTYTQGTGYFTDNNDNRAIDDIVSFDNDYKRKNNTGTDIFIIGFKGIDDSWESEVISSVVDSFLVAIYKQRLIVKVGDLEISKNSLESIILSENYIKDKTIKNNAICNLRILNGKDVEVFNIDTDYGNPTLYILPLARQEEDLATHSCSMIRYPYMKIKGFQINKNYRVAAMCLIENGKLCNFLRDIENPEHTDWQPNRLKGDLKVEANGILKSIKQQIDNRIEEVLKIGDEDSIDPNRAGEFLPSIDAGEDGLNSEGENDGQKESSRIANVKEVKTFSYKQGFDSDEGGTSLEPDTGDFSEGNESPHPEGNNKGGGGEPHGGTGTGKTTLGDLIILKNTDKSPVKYKFITIDKNNGKYRIIFISPISNDECYLNLRLLDDMNNKTNIEIKSIMIDGKTISSINNIKYGPFSIEMNKKMVLDIHTQSLRGLFGSEVRVLCK